MRQKQTKKQAFMHKMPAIIIISIEMHMEF